MTDLAAVGGGVLGRGELHAAATVHGGAAGALVVAQASKRAARTSGAGACVQGQEWNTRGLDIKGSEQEDSNHVPGPRRA